MALRFVYVTASSEVEAKTIGRALVEERLVACANVIPGMQSIYHWQGKIQEDQEAVLILKTEDSRVEDVIKRVRELHSYEVPCVLSLPIETGNPAYLAWLTESLR